MERAVIETLTLHVEGHKGSAVQPTLEIILFSSAPREKVAPGFVALYRALVERYGDTLKWHKTNVMKSFKKLSEAGVRQIEQMLTDKKALKGHLLGVEQHSGPAASHYELPTFEFFSEEDLSEPEDLIRHSFVRACLPIAEAARADDVHAFLRSALADVEFDSGYCGYSYYWNTGESDVERELAKVSRGWLTRFPGLGYGEPLALFSFVDKGVLGVNWITLLGQPLVERLGGEADLAVALGPSIDVQPIGGGRGVVIRAGVGPELGDANRNQKLPAYQKVGRAIADLRVPDEWIENMAMIGMSGEDVVEWYGRFFGVE